MISLVFAVARHVEENMMLGSDHYTAGFVRRAENFPEVAALADSFQGIKGVTWHGLTDTVLSGFRFLDISEGSLHVLMLLCRYLNAQQWAEGDTLVWPSNETLAQDCGVSARSVQGRLRELERAGLVIREYTRLNSRMTRSRRRNAEGGIDLAPLGAKLPGLRSMVDAAKREAQIDRQARYERFDVASDMKVNSCRDENSFAHKQSHLNYHPDTVPPAAKASDESDASRRIADGIPLEAQPNKHPSRKTKDRSPGGEGSDFAANHSGSSAAEKAHSVLVAAIEQSPTLRELPLLQELGSASVDAILARLGDVVAALFPERNTLQTWRWAVTRHSWRAGLCLVAALDDPTVRDRYRMLGYFATQIPAGELDLSSNFKRIQRLQPAPVEVEPAPIAEESADHHPTWSAILDHLRTDLGAATVKAWIAPLIYRDIEDGRLRLVAPSRFLADHVRQDFEQRLLIAARRVDRSIHRLVIEISS